ncbi:hypothetical protein [Coleofasciculus sp. FACHB-1120]|uniref:hypothetical protein n=1 Tax=Coleofasciculus sp. FACHB-1120 TaxID=2692783 RepID=UPI00168877AA|nr:hypothetical protein [Coleofasciculus sp. FACHB-1120]MBD2741146.1 hypothetical protein [Coleofasciculus sp. FACHB-1120]
MLVVLVRKQSPNWVNQWDEVRSLDQIVLLKLSWDGGSRVMPIPKRFLQAATITFLLNVIAALSVPTAIQTPQSLPIAKSNTNSELAESTSAQLHPY